MKFFIGLSFCAVALAQSSATGVMGGIIGPAGGAAVWTYGPNTFSGSITGAPYSAEQTTEHVQTLADGTRITQPSEQVKFYRDSQGRTRTERTPALAIPSAAVPGDPPVFIEISDPVSGNRYTMDSHSRTAHRMTVPHPPTPPPPPPPGSTASSPTVTLANRVGSFMPAAAPANRPQISRESLGAQTIEGVMAEGTRTTMVYPVGAVGNDRPITATTETWTSPELKIVVLSKSSDPRNGDSTTRLTNISRAEPDASLFQVPADYQIVDPSGAGR